MWSRMRISKVLDPDPDPNYFGIRCTGKEFLLVCIKLRHLDFLFTSYMTDYIFYFYLSFLRKES